MLQPLALKTFFLKNCSNTYTSCVINVTVFERHGIGYVLESGSALGAERHQGITPWDDDLDIAVHENFESLLLKEAATDLCEYSIYNTETHRQQANTMYELS